MSVSKCDLDNACFLSPQAQTVQLIKTIFLRKELLERKANVVVRLEVVHVCCSLAEKSAKLTANGGAADLSSHNLFFSLYIRPGR